MSNGEFAKTFACECDNKEQVQLKLDECAKARLEKYNVDESRDSSMCDAQATNTITSAANIDDARPPQDIFPQLHAPT